MKKNKLIFKKIDWNQTFNIKYIYFDNKYDNKYCYSKSIQHYKIIQYLIILFNDK